MSRVTDISSWVLTPSVQRADPIHSDNPAKPLQTSVDIGSGDRPVKPDRWSHFWTVLMGHRTSTVISPGEVEMLRRGHVSVSR
jgi:hypothetical protein